MKEKMEEIRKRLTQLQAEAHDITVAIQTLLTEMAARSLEVKELDGKFQKLQQVTADLNKASTELLDVQRKRESLHHDLAQLREKITV